MLTLLFVLALAANVRGFAVDLSLDRRAPFTTYTPNCAPDPVNAIDDAYFGGSGSAFGPFNVTGNLQVHSAFDQTYGLQADTNNRQAFVFQITGGSGTFSLYQDVCLTTGNNQIHNSSYNLGVTSPQFHNGEESTSGCDVVFQLNGASTARQVPVCELPSASNPWGVCNLPSYNAKTRYVQHSMIFTTNHAVNRVGILFNCTANGSGVNAQVAVDRWRIMPWQQPIASA